MKHGREYAKQVKHLWKDLARKYDKPSGDELTDPLDQLVASILAESTSFNKGWSAYRKLSEQMVDMNELRVTPASELAAMIDKIVPLAEIKAGRIVDALNDVRKRQDTLSLDFLKQRGRRESREYLESLEGVGHAAAAATVLFSLGGHAIPIDDLTLYILRKDEVVDPQATGPEVQSFLERHINSGDARAFVELLNRHVITKAARVDVTRLDELLTPPPPEPAPEPDPAPEPAKPAPKKSTTDREAQADQASKKKSATGKTDRTASTRGKSSSGSHSMTKKKAATRPASRGKTTAKRKKK